jgi:two-component system cell cycle sensor histidine kinase/response regulator CckA
LTGVVSVVPVFDNEGTCSHLVGSVHDITERKRGETALRENEERLRASEARLMSAQRLAKLGSWERDDTTGTTKFSDEMLRILGMPDYPPPTLLDFLKYVHPDDRDMVREGALRARSRGGPEAGEYRIVRADGEVRIVRSVLEAIRSEQGAVIRVVGATQDVTDLKRAQEEALARQKLESVGVLAGGIAHDFNNLLGSILIEAELVEADLAGGLPPYEEITRIKKVAIRGAEILRELMTYAGRDQATAFEPVDLSRLTTEMLELMKVSISKHAVLKINLDKDLPAVLGNAPQIRQVLMNLIINASEAIGEKEGMIRVTTSRVTGGQGSALNNAANVIAGDYVRLEVWDDGCGLTEEAKVKIFDPFYTTKFAGRGLGLAVVQGIVRVHGGAIDVVSAPGQGATFQVLLPCTSTKASDAQNAVASAGAERAPALTRLGTTVLVVEDEEVLRIAVSKALRIKGFAVMEAEDGSVAMDLIRTHRDDIDVILLDVTLPGTSSKEVFEEAHHMRAGMKVVLTSAYERKTVEALFPGLRFTQFIRKPFQLNDLVGTLRDALAGEVAPQKAMNSTSPNADTLLEGG